MIYADRTIHNAENDYFTMRVSHYELKNDQYEGKISVRVESPFLKDVQIPGIYILKVLMRKIFSSIDLEITNFSEKIGFEVVFKTFAELMRNMKLCRMEVNESDGKISILINGEVVFTQNINL